ncbi:uncharacterized protein LOC119028646 isoform X2 [Acanthopagrus latus]|uniref:uncharacterized protein LOC119028646 isoform X2 n=1 Tax=Acanthopagrus latus TaxID=8177 RepID=UPI00187BFF85|nr:uncharacterized protein LOC119028646 isoform X2 [Acanthopagrus latus]
MDMDVDASTDTTFTFGLMFPGAAAETQLDLRCNVTRRPGGSTLYRVSEPRGSNRCTRDWMGQNNTVFARNSHTDAARVLDVTDTSITLRGCEDFLHLTRDCREGFEEAFCTVNCSEPLAESQPRTVNSTLICISQSFCLQPLMFWIVITIIIIIIIALCVGVSVRLYLRKRKRKEAAMEMVEYRAVSDVIKVQIDQYI